MTRQQGFVLRSARLQVEHERKKLNIDGWLRSQFAHVRPINTQVSFTLNKFADLNNYGKEEKTIVVSEGYIFDLMGTETSTSIVVSRILSDGVELICTISSVGSTERYVTKVEWNRRGS